MSFQDLRPLLPHQGGTWDFCAPEVRLAAARVAAQFYATRKAKQ